MIGLRSQKNSPIPTVWRIDVEPDAFQPDGKEQPWDGFVSTVKLVEGLRNRLADRSVRAVHPTWFIRLDPDIERCFGRHDYVVQRYSEEFAQLAHHQDALGIHAMRTHSPGSVWAERARTLLDYLPNHPIAERLCFVDPLGPEIQALPTPHFNPNRGW